MAYDLEEQEQLAQFKAWWQKWGNTVLTAVTVVLLGFAGWNGWRWYQADQAKSAAAVYAQIEQAIAARDAAKVQTLATSLREHYGRTTYAVIAALQAARLNADVGDYAKAAEQLRWVIDKSGHDELTMIARVRLAGVLLDDKKYDEALQALAFEPPATYATTVLDRRGDVLAAQNKTDEARAAYADALAKADEQHPLRAIIQLKLDALPAAPAKS
jgi:predicted negative regulator of RcsB-dependent stress response